MGEGSEDGGAGRARHHQRPVTDVHLMHTAVVDDVPLRPQTPQSEERRDPITLAPKNTPK